MGQLWYDVAVLGKVSYGRRGKVRLGKARCDEVGFGKARHV